MSTSDQNHDLHGSGAAAQLQREIADKRTNDNDSDEENELWSGGYSPKAMVGTWIAIAIVSVALIILAISVPPAMLVSLGLVPFVWVIGGIVYTCRRLGVQYELTNQRFIHQKGILSRQTDRIEVIDIDDVTCKQGLIERIFGVGTIVLTGSDRTHPTLSMIGIADVKEVAGLIDDTRRQERRRRSLHIEAI